MSMNYYIFFMGISLGIIGMTAIYNAVLYYYNREKAFLSYALMQLGILSVLFYDEVLIFALMPNHQASELIYYFISLYALTLVLIFAYTFLEIKKYLPEQIKKFKIIFIMMYTLFFIDMILYPSTLFFDFGLHLLIFVYVNYLGYLRSKQHSKSARFYLLGWSIFALFVMVDAITTMQLENILFNPIVIGSVLEAIILAIALGYKVNQTKKEQIKQQQLLIHQSKLASMGELLGNIAHQWRQPLTGLSYTFMNIETSDTEAERNKLVSEGTNQLEFMSQTIDDFTNFYAPSKEKETFSLAEESHNILELVHYDEIDIEIKVTNESTIFNYKNEYKQVLLNLLSNAKDVLLSREVQHPKITIMIDDKKVTVTDNAGGIQLEVIEKIFEPYFTTKESGLGIGLYMSKVIIEKNMGGTLNVIHGDDGAIFEISLP